MTKTDTTDKVGHLWTGSLGKKSKKQALCHYLSLLSIAFNSTKQRVIKHTMDGAFERINAAILKEGTNSQVISLVGRVVGYDGNGQATVEAADGGMVQVTNVEPAFNYVEGMIAEIMGAPIGGDSIQVSCFVGCSCLIFLPTKLSENSRTYLTNHIHTTRYYGTRGIPTIIYTPNNIHSTSFVVTWETTLILQIITN